MDLVMKGWRRVSMRRWSPRTQSFGEKRQLEYISRRALRRDGKLGGSQKYLGRGGKYHSAFHRNDNGIHKIVGIEFPLDCLQVFPNRTFVHPFCRRNLLDNLSPRATFQNNGFTLREERMRIGALACSSQPRNDALK